MLAPQRESRCKHSHPGPSKASEFPALCNLPSQPPRRAPGASASGLRIKRTKLRHKRLRRELSGLRGEPRCSAAATDDPIHQQVPRSRLGTGSIRRSPPFGAARLPPGFPADGAAAHRVGTGWPRIGSLPESRTIARAAPPSRSLSERCRPAPRVPSAPQPLCGSPGPGSLCPSGKPA
jgi:hypothetical protein